MELRSTEVQRYSRGLVVVGMLDDLVLVRVGLQAVQRPVAPAGAPLVHLGALLAVGGAPRAAGGVQRGGQVDEAVALYLPVRQVQVQKTFLVVGVLEDRRSPVFQPLGGSPRRVTTNVQVPPHPHFVPQLQYVLVPLLGVVVPLHLLLLVVVVHELLQVLVVLLVREHPLELLVVVLPVDHLLVAVPRGPVHPLVSHSQVAHVRIAVPLAVVLILVYRARARAARPTVRGRWLAVVGACALPAGRAAMAVQLVYSVGRSSVLVPCRRVLPATTAHVQLCNR